MRLETDVGDEIANIYDELSKQRELLAQHEVRFSNGREVMAEMKNDITSLKPKAPDWLKLLGYASGLLVATLGAHFWLIQQFNERPTAVQIEKAFHEHSEMGHAAVQRQVDDLRDRQSVQEALLTGPNGLVGMVGEQGRKLDMILTRLPKR
jgi:hypothetical protein